MGFYILPTFSFFLSDQTSEFDGFNWISELGQGGMYTIGTYLKGFFDQVCQLDSCPYNTSDFTWNPAAASASNLVIYFINSSADSLVSKVNPGTPLGEGGTTLLDPAGNLSEVYFTSPGTDGASDLARQLAVLAFHESMHNLLQLGKSLHASGGMGLAAEVVPENASLTDTNKKLMAPAMGNDIPQNTSFL
jgi:hypothetical protein